LVRQYFRIPPAPPERNPSPESFQPPNGTGVCPTPNRTLLMCTSPVLSRRADAIAFALSRVHTLPDRPNRESLAFSIAS
jgi:hypothetical protein